MNPATTNPALIPLDSPARAGVRTNRTGSPVEIRLGGRKSSGRVISIHETWRIDDEWWRTPISRLYHRLVLENGKMLTVYRDLTDGKWYVQ